ncbi:hypothetical protein AVEN_83043-1 [Araneus ventricosus]|uniref:Uncharacterized protein n=1 Tax=Araneus ventricosus TaxID=182803 RepID=A0A4Y2AN63_ARAVE|nr:hypothetical protein AVEN_83043-1 [Araneus ventricosus]
MLWKFLSLLAGIQALDLVAISSHLQVVSTGLHGEVSRHFSSRAPGLTLQESGGYVHLRLGYKRKCTEKSLYSLG